MKCFQFLFFLFITKGCWFFGLSMAKSLAKQRRATTLCRKSQFSDASFFRAEISTQTHNGFSDPNGLLRAQICNIWTKQKRRVTPPWLQTPVCYSKPYWVALPRYGSHIFSIAMIGHSPERKQSIIIENPNFSDAPFFFLSRLCSTCSFCLPRTISSLPQFHLF